MSAEIDVVHPDEILFRSQLREDLAAGSEPETAKLPRAARTAIIGTAAVLTWGMIAAALHGLHAF